MDLLPKNLSQLSRAQVGKLAAKIGQLYVVDNMELFSIFFLIAWIQHITDLFFSSCLILPVRYNNFLMRHIFCAKSGSPGCGLEEQLSSFLMLIRYDFSNMIFEVSHLVIFNEINSSLFIESSYLNKQRKSSPLRVWFLVGTFINSASLVQWRRAKYSKHIPWKRLS